MNNIKTKAAQMITNNVDVFLTSDNAYILGYRKDYIGPRDPRYKEIGAVYTGEVIKTLSDAVGEILFFGITCIIDSIHENGESWPIDRFGLKNIIEAAEIYDEISNL